MFKNKTVVNFLVIALVGLGLYGIVRPQEEVRKKPSITSRTNHWKFSVLNFAALSYVSTKIW